MFSRVFLSPSYSHFRESHSRTITIPDKSPDLFPFILDYLRGYTFFPLVEAAVPAHWLPLSKTYDNLRRDAAYYGLLRLEAECLKWWRQTLDPEDRQCALRLDFVPFTPGQSILRGHPLTAEMALDVHLADVHLLRKRFMKPGGKTLTYGPFPWKQIFEQIRDPCDRDGPLQSDGSAIVELNSTFLKPPREITGSTADTDEDDRKIEFAKVHISKAITQLILHNVKPGGLNNHITLRFHTTSVTTLLHFSTPDCPASTPIARAQFLFSDKVQSEGYFNLRSTVKHENLLDDPNSWPHMSAEKVTFAMDVDGDVALQVDGGKVVWRELCEWSRVHSMFYSETSSREVLELEQGDVVNRRTHAIFGGNRDPTTGAAIVTLPLPSPFTLFVLTVGFRPPCLGVRYLFLRGQSSIPFSLHKYFQFEDPVTVNGNDNDRYGRAITSVNSMLMQSQRQREQGRIKRGPLSSDRKIMSWWMRDLASLSRFIKVAIIFFDCGI